MLTVLVRTSATRIYRYQLKVILQHHSLSSTLGLREEERKVEKL